MMTASKRRHHGRFRPFVAFAQQYRGYHRIPAGCPVPQADTLNMKVVRKGSFLRIAPSCPSILPSHAKSSDSQIFPFIWMTRLCSRSLLSLSPFSALPLSPFRPPTSRCTARLTWVSSTRPVKSPSATRPWSMKTRSPWKTVATLPPASASRVLKTSATA